MDNIEITAIKYGEAKMSENLIFRGGLENKTQTISFIVYLLKFKNRLILVDSGCNTMPKEWDMKYFCGPIPILNKMGISPDDITDLIITHSHHDHIELTPLYKNAVIYIQKDEYINGKSYIPLNARVITFDKTYKVLNGIEIIKIGGHTAGSSIVKIKTKGKEFVITGDECYSMECFIRQIPTGSSTFIEKSEDFIKKYKDCNLLLCHDKKILPHKSGSKKII